MTSILNLKNNSVARAILSFQVLATLYKNLYNLKQYGSIEGYTEAFYQLVAQVDISESEEQIVARYVSGLKPIGACSTHFVVCLKRLTIELW